MSIVFTHGYFLQDDPKEQEIMRPYPPLGILCISAWLEKHGLDNEVFDTTFSDKNTQRSFLEARRPAIIAIYTNLMTKINVIELMRYLKNSEILKESLIVLGGPDVTYNTDNYLQAGADVLVIGEGEQTMLELAQGVGTGRRKDFFDIPGLVYKDIQGNIIRTAARKKIPDIDELPVPNRHKIDLGRYLEVWKKHHGQSTVSVSTQRGCPYTCRWCSTAVYGQSYRRRAPSVVVDELQHLAETYSPDLFWFVDDVFTVSHKWLREFRDELQRRGLAIRFECITRADRLNPEVIGVLKECGCFRVWIGAESGSQRIIDAMDRRVDVHQVREMIREAKKNGIEAGTFIMLGYPGETEQDIRHTMEHLRRSDPDLFTITIAYPIKGTGLYEEVEARMTARPDWEESTDRDLDFQRTYPRKYYDYAVRWVVNSVHLHRQRSAGRVWTPTALKLLLKAGAARLGMRLNRVNK